MKKVIDLGTKVLVLVMLFLMGFLFVLLTTLTLLDFAGIWKIVAIVPLIFSIFFALLFVKMLVEPSIKNETKKEKQKFEEWLSQKYRPFLGTVETSTTEVKKTQEVVYGVSGKKEKSEDGDETVEIAFISEKGQVSYPFNRWLADDSHDNYLIWYFGDDLIIVCRKDDFGVGKPYVRK